MDIDAMDSGHGERNSSFIEWNGLPHISEWLRSVLSIGDVL
jgi:hypothetical protein